MQALVRDLRDEELEKAFELVRVAAHRGRHPRGIDVLCRLERAHLELEPVAEPLDAAEHAHGVSFGEAGVEQLDVVPDPRRDPAARVDELEREIRGAVSRAQPLLLRDRVDALDGAVLLELGDRGHGLESKSRRRSRCESRPAPPSARNRGSPRRAAGDGRSAARRRARRRASGRRAAARRRGP